MPSDDKKRRAAKKKEAAKTGRKNVANNNTLNVNEKGDTVDQLNGTCTPTDGKEVLNYDFSN